MTIELHGYRYSVYLRIVAMALAEKKVCWTHIEVDPFSDEIPESYLALSSPSPSADATRRSAVARFR